MTLYDWIEATQRMAERGLRRPPVRLANGMEFCVHVGQGRYCTPDDDTGPYTEVELVCDRDGCQLVPYEMRDRYRIRRIRGGRVVYGYVPVWLLQKWINKNGGIVFEQGG